MKCTQTQKEKWLFTKRARTRKSFPTVLKNYSKWRKTELDLQGPICYLRFHKRSENLSSLATVRLSAVNLCHCVSCANNNIIYLFIYLFIIQLVCFVISRSMIFKYVLRLAQKGKKKYKLFGRNMCILVFTLYMSMKYLY